MSDSTTRHSSEAKTCSKCKQEKPLDEFGRDRSRADGLRYDCKVCQSEYSRAFYAANKERVAEWNRAWRKANPEKVTAREARRRARCPDRIAARKAVSNAVRSGKMPPPRNLPCSTCGVPAEQYHHHLGYAPEHALDVIPVCIACHFEHY